MAIHVQTVYESYFVTVKFELNLAISMKKIKYKSWQKTKTIQNIHDVYGIYSLKGIYYKSWFDFNLKDVSWLHHPPIEFNTNLLFSKNHSKCSCYS